ncbi:hypothetical protein DFH94DRAFT_467980 [Russula ochroleuca]|jgi:hypothetical protein|uniref:Uncharacterized protein n=1 Tax=Russula ochroleuca TaxID=152965 RepID=A0A9P5T8Y1_9AGAM|nr:hypothetical protein DFH94DRAFT_467980 [Russula ochroleuca]
MSRFQQTTTSATTPTPAARKLANKERRKAGREVNKSPHTFKTPPRPNTLFFFLPQRHEERKTQLKDLEWDRKWERLQRDAAQRQDKRRDDGTRAFAGRNVYNHRVACATDIIDVAVFDSDQDQQQQQQQQQQAHYDSEEQVIVPHHATSGATLLAMARPAKSRRRRSPPVMQMTDGEAFEIVEIDGRLVALDEDGWEILPDENAEVSLLYSDIVRGTSL